MQPPYSAAFYFVLCSKDQLSDLLTPYAWGWEGLGEDEGEAGERSTLSSTCTDTEKCHPRKWSQASVRRQLWRPPPSLRFGQFLLFLK